MEKGLKQNKENWLQIILKMKGMIQEEKEKNPKFDEEEFTRDMLGAMFFSKQFETPWEGLTISLKEEDKLNYVAKLEWLFQSVGIFSSYFAKTPVDETYDAFDCFLNYMVCLKAAYLDLATYDRIHLCANKLTLKKLLKEYEEYQDFIFIGKELLSMENLLVEDISNPHFLKEQQCRKRERIC